MKAHLLRDCQSDVLIIDDASSCILEHGVVLKDQKHLNNLNIRGFWDLVSDYKTVYLLSSVAPKDFLITIQETCLQKFHFM